MSQNGPISEFMKIFIRLRHYHQERSIREIQPKSDTFLVNMLVPARSDHWHSEIQQRPVHQDLYTAKPKLKMESLKKNRKVEKIENLFKNRKLIKFATLVETSDTSTPSSSSSIYGFCINAGSDGE